MPSSSFPDGTRIILTGLSSNTESNGKAGIVTCFRRELNRYCVRLANGTPVQVLAVNMALEPRPTETLTARELSFILEKSGNKQSTKEMNKTDLQKAVSDISDPEKNAEILRHFFQKRQALTIRSLWQKLPPIHFAVSHSPAEEVKALLASQRELANSPEEQYGFLPLMTAMTTNRLDTVLILLDGGADVNAQVDVPIRDHHGKTALHMACTMDDSDASIKFAEALLEHGANPAIKDALGVSPLSYAAMKNRPELVSMILRYLDQVLHHDLAKEAHRDASLNGSEACCHLLENYGANSLEPRPVETLSVKELKYVLEQSGYQQSTMGMEKSDLRMTVSELSSPEKNAKILCRFDPNAKKTPKNDGTSSLEPRPVETLSIKELKYILEQSNYQQTTRGMEKTDLQNAVSELSNPQKNAEILRLFVPAVRTTKQMPNSNEELSRFHTSITQSPPEEVKALLTKRKEWSNAPETNTGLTPLMLAVNENRLEIVLILLEDGGADVVARGSKELQGTTALHRAALSGASTEIVDILLRYGANGALKDSSGTSALSCMARLGLTQMLSKLLSYGGDVLDQKVIAEAHLNASRNGHEDCCHVLVNKAADLGQSMVESLDDAKTLEQTVMKPQERLVEDTEHTEEYFFRTILNSSVYEVKELLQQDSLHVHRREKRFNQTALHLASSRDRTPIVKLLLESGARVNAQDNNGETSLHIASRVGCLSTVVALLEAGADPNLGNRESWTALFDAAFSKRLDILKAILGTDIAIDQNALNKALSACRFEVACSRVLLNRGADANCRLPGLDRSVFHYACYDGNIDFVRLCLEYEVDVNARFGDMTALDLALEQNHWSIAELLQNTISPETRNTGNTGMDMARSLVFCHRCPAKLIDSGSYYKCLTCEKDQTYRRYCQSCVLDPKQQANLFCPGHVLARVGEAQRTTQKNRGKDGQEDSALRNKRGFVRSWLSTKPIQTDCLGMYSTVKALSDALHFAIGNPLDFKSVSVSKDFELVLAVLATEIPYVDLLYPSFSMSEMYLFTAQMRSALIERCPHAAVPTRDLNRWLMSRALRPVDNVPSWMALLGCSSSNHSELCDMLCWVIYLRLEKPIAGLFSNLQNLEGAFVQTKAREPILTKTKIGDLPVALISCKELFLRNQMPEHRLCRIVEMGQSDGPILKIFVSHTWRAEQHPDRQGNDWISIRNFIHSMVLRAIVLYIELSACGFTSSLIAEDAFLEPKLPGESLDLKKRFEIDGWTDSTKQAPILSQLLQIICFCRKDDGFPNDDDIHTLYTKVVERTYLWIDFVSLPQALSCKRTASEEKWFRESLRKMGSIQRAMCTLLVDPSDKYFTRAWCVAEYVNSNGEFSIAQEADRASAMSASAPNAEAWLRAMVRTQTSSAEDVIEALGLKITNNADADIVCGVVWSRIGPYLQKKATAGTTTSSSMMKDYIRGIDQATVDLVWDMQPSWLIAESRAQVIVDYLEATCDETFLSYTDGWLKWRKALGKESEKAEQKAQTVNFLVDSCVSKRPHMLSSSLKSLALFIKAIFDSDTWLRVNLMSEYSAVAPRCKDSLVVALPTSVFADQADFIILHPSQMAFVDPQYKIMMDDAFLRRK